MLRGGRHDPHITHSNGDCFDINLPLTTQPWLRFRYKDPISDAVATKLRERFGELWGVCQTAGEFDKEDPSALVFSTPTKNSASSSE